MDNELVDREPCNRRGGAVERRGAGGTARGPLLAHGNGDGGDGGVCDLRSPIAVADGLATIL